MEPVPEGLYRRDMEPFCRGGVDDGWRSPWEMRSVMVVLRVGLSPKGEGSGAPAAQHPSAPVSILRSVGRWPTQLHQTR